MRLEFKWPIVFSLPIKIVFFLSVTILLASVQVQAKADKDDTTYQKTSEKRPTHMTMSVGLPAVVVVDTERFKEGDLEVARDIITGNRLIATIHGGETQGLKIIGTSGQAMKLKPVGPRDDFSLQCSRRLCLTNQFVRCYTTPWGDCICTCGGFFTTPGNGVVGCND